jgi:hypothetical protein
MSDTRSTPRREFLGTLATTAVALTGVAACAPAAAAVQAAAPTPAGAGQAARPVSNWDDSWFAKLTAPHKAVFDSANFGDGLAIDHATRYLNAMKEVWGGEPQAVVVIRHTAIPMAFNDAMWTKYKIGDAMKINDRGGAPATRNPYTAQLESFVRGGGILLGCDLATRARAGSLAASAGVDRNTAYADIKANLVTGMILQPNGIYAFHRAQEAGCTGMQSTM